MQELENDWKESRKNKGLPTSTLYIALLISFPLSPSAEQQDQDFEDLLFHNPNHGPVLDDSDDNVEAPPDSGSETEEETEAKAGISTKP